MRFVKRRVFDIKDLSETELELLIKWGISSKLRKGPRWDMQERDLLAELERNLSSTDQYREEIREYEDEYRADEGE